MTAARAVEDFIIIGAGIAGLSCARAVQQAGAKPVVLERSRGVGGRCATRRVEAQPVDHGVIFLHGADPAFLEALEAVENATPLPGWPKEVSGKGTPCQPEAFLPYQRRLAFAEGLTAFPKHLSRRLDVRLGSRVSLLGTTENGFRVETEDGSHWEAPNVIVALAVEQTFRLMEGLPSAAKEIRAARKLVGELGTEPCLTLLAGYPLDGPAPYWDVLYPEESAILMLASHDSTKRPDKKSHVLVYQCRPRWSREHLEEDPSTWAAQILQEAARLLGPWAGKPAWTQSHRWRYARTGTGATLTAPLLLEFPGGGKLGLAGEIFAAGGGVEAAWLSGQRLARRILGDTNP